MPRVARARLAAKPTPEKVGSAARFGDQARIGHNGGARPPAERWLAVECGAHSAMVLPSRFSCQRAASRHRPPHRGRGTPLSTPARTRPVRTTPATARPATDFAGLGVPAPIVAALRDRGIVDPFPIQSVTLPDSLAGKDVLGRGQTGSGKTVAFAVPMVARLASSTTRRRANRPRALVLVPTRELANQVAETVTPLAAAMGLTTTTIFGGVGQGPQVSALTRGVDIVIACPGRLDDLIKQRHCNLGAVEVTVLDEADHMADLGFLPVVRRILDTTPTGQRLLFSATLDNGVDVLVRRYLNRPVTHSVAPVVASVDSMEHHVYAVPAGSKGAVVRELASGHGKVVMFTRTKHAAKKLSRQLTATGIPAVELQGNLSQGARERNLAAFSEGSVRVLVATDIAARGIHVDDVNLVVHVDPPMEHKAYLHRSGRTARAGAGGTVVTVMTPDQAGDVRTLTRQAGITPTITHVAPGDSSLRGLVGPAAPLVEPVALPAVPMTSSPRGGGQRANASRRRGGSRGFGATSGAGTSRGGGSSRTNGNARGANGRSNGSTGSGRLAADFSSGMRARRGR